MPDEHEVRAALAEVVSRVDALDDDTRRKIPDRAISAVITDLDLAWIGRFESGQLLDVREIDPSAAAGAAFRLRMSSDTFLDVVEDRLAFTAGWGKGRIRVDAGLRDLLALRSFL